MQYHDEIWKELDLDHLDPKNRHWVSNYGRAKKTYLNAGNAVRIYNPPLRRDGARLIIVKLRSGASKNLALHRMVAEQFCEKQSEDQKYVLHADYDKENNRASNLIWATHEEYIKHYRSNPKWIAACKNNKFGTKLTESQVKVIKRLLKNPKNKLEHIASKFGVTPRHIGKIRSGSQWSEVIID